MVVKIQWPKCHKVHHQSVNNFINARTDVPWKSAKVPKALVKSSSTTLRVVINEENMCGETSPQRVRSKLHVCSEQKKKKKNLIHRVTKRKQTWNWGLGEKTLPTTRNRTSSETTSCMLEDMDIVISGGKLTQHSKIGTPHQIKHSGFVRIATLKRKGYS